MKIIYLLLITATLWACEGQQEQMVEHYDNGAIKTKGVTIDGKKEGTFYTYHLNGKLYKVEKYSNGILNGISKEYTNYPSAIIAISLYKDGDAIEQKVYDTISNNILMTFRESTSRIYDNGKLTITINSEDPNNLKFIKFNTNGSIKDYSGPLDFLNKEDIANLNNNYPTWKEMIKEFE